MLDAKYVDVWRLLHPDDAGYTFPTWDPHVRLGCAFTPDRYAERVDSLEVVREPEVVKTTSDHHPLLIAVRRE